jgi:hypothetical protein
LVITDEERAMSLLTPHSSPLRASRGALKFWLVPIVVLIVAASYMKVHASHAPAQLADASNARGSLQHRIAQKIEKEVEAELPAEYRHIKPAGIEGRVPPIPPSETWPAQ